MKHWILISIVCLFIGGCAEQGFVGGFAGGVAAMKVLAEDSQDKFIAAVNEMNDETARINATIGAIDGTILIKPETIEALKSLKDRGNDPVTWIALASILTNAVWGGRAIEKKLKKKS